jgi:hypothetical protein
MLKLVLFVIGLAGGTVAWLLSEPGPSIPPGAPMAERLNALKRHVNAARVEGKVAGTETENRIRHEFETYRLHPDRPGTSS